MRTMLSGNGLIYIFFFVSFIMMMTWASPVLAERPFSQNSFGFYKTEVPNLIPVATDGNATLYTLGNLSVIRLEGNFREMGRQYGQLQGTEIARMYDEVISDLPSLSLISRVTTETELLEISEQQFKLYPERFKEIALGMSETSGIPVSHIIAIDQFFQITVTSHKEILKPISGHCSSLIAWGEYTNGETLIMGRNFDFFNTYQKFYPYQVLILYHPTDGCVPVGTLGYAGNIGGVEAFNAAGLVLETNDNSNVPYPENVSYNSRIPFNLLIVQLLLDAETLDQLDAALNTTRFGYPMLFNVADEHTGYTYEGGTRTIIKRGDINEGLQVISNLPIDSSWNISELDENLTFNSKERRSNLINLSNIYKGRINTTIMEQILDQSIEDGGAGILFNQSTPINISLSTIYRYVYVPKSRVLSLRSPAYDSWASINLSPLFS